MTKPVEQRQLLVEAKERHERSLETMHESLAASAKLPGHEEYAAEMAPLVARMEKRLREIRSMLGEAPQ